MILSAVPKLDEHFDMLSLHYKDSNPLDRNLLTLGWQKLASPLDYCNAWLIQISRSPSASDEGWTHKYKNIKEQAMIITNIFTDNMHKLSGMVRQIDKDALNRILAAACQSRMALNNSRNRKMQDLGEYKKLNTTQTTIVHILYHSFHS